MCFFCLSKGNQEKTNHISKNNNQINFRKKTNIERNIPKAFKRPG